MVARALISALCLGAVTASPALADRIKHPTAVFAGLDKITGRIIAFDVAIDETVQFGSLQITPRVCYTRPATEAPMTTAFVEVDEVDEDNKYKRIFGGWMFAASPGLHAIEHPVYDAWLTDCKGGTDVIPDSVARAEPPAQTPSPPARRDAPAQENTQAPRPLQQELLQQETRQEPPPFDNPIEVAPPPGLRPPAAIGGGGADRQAPSQQFFPTNPGGPPAEVNPFGTY